MKRITKPLLIFLAVTGIVMAGLQVINIGSSVRAVAITSELMEPTIYRGSLMFMKQIPEEDLKPGDIIAVELPDQHSHAVGRFIQSSQMADDYYNLTFKGDNRTLPEEFPYTVKDSTYISMFSIPVLGYFVAFLTSPFGLILFGAAALYFAWYFLFKMHDRLTWAERSTKIATYNERVAREKAEERKQYGGLADIFPEHEFNDDYDTTELAKVEEQKR